ncbi:MAG: Virulence-associated outer membrane protein Vir-90 [Verrucomicrobiota bacterium]|jgi:catecholate siderophore receptor
MNLVQKIAKQLRQEEILRMPRLRKICPLVQATMSTLALSQGLYAQEGQVTEAAPQNQPATEGARRNFKVPAQPLSSSLAEIAAQGEVQVKTSAELLSGRTAPALTGSHTVEEAFRLVLAASGLQMVKADGAYRLERIEAGALEEVEVSGHLIAPQTLASRKFEEPLKSTQTANVIDSEVIQQQGVSSVKDVLRNSPGITFRSGEGGAPLGDNLFIRGASATNDVFVDGFRNSGEQSRDAYNLEQVEVFKGPNSANFGRGSSGGAINLVTKKAKLEDFSTLSIGGGSHEYWRNTLDSNCILSEKNGGAIRLNAMTAQAAVPDRDQTENESLAVNPSLAYGLGTATRLSLAYEHLQQESLPDNGIPTLAYDSYRSPNTSTTAQSNSRQGRHGVDRRNFYGFPHRDEQKLVSDKVDFGIEQDLDDDWTLSNNSSLLNSRNFVWGTVTQGLGKGNPASGAVTANDSGSDLSIDDKIRDTEVLTLQNNSLLTGKFETGGLKHSAVTGLDLSWERFEQFENTSATYSRDGGASFQNSTYTDLHSPDTASIITKGGGQRTGGSQRSQADGIGLYLGDTVDLNEQWSVNGMGRLDYYSIRQEDDRKLTAANTDGLGSDELLPSWRSGLAYKPAENGSIYFGIGNSLSPASSNATNGYLFSSSASSTARSDLEPIETRSCEIGTKWEFFDQKLNLFAAVFENDVKNNLTLVPGSSPAEYLQIGSQTTQGLELGASGKINETWTLLGGYAIMRSEIDSLQAYEDGNEVPFTPEQSASLWTQHQITDKFSFGLGAQYSGMMTYDTRGTQAPDEARYILYNAMANYQFNQSLSLQLNLNNLLDEDYIAAGGPSRVIPGAGRSGFLTLTYKF